MNKKWSMVKKDVILDRPFAHVEAWTMRTHADVAREFDIGIFRDAVQVIGRLSNGMWVIIKQFVVAAEDYCYGVVAGYIEENELPEDAARREFREETGYTLGDVTFLGSTMRDKWVTGLFHFYVGEIVGDQGEQQLEEAEDITVHELTTEELLVLLERNEIHDVAGVACVERVLRLTK